MTGEDRTRAREWLTWFIKQPQVWCAPCRRWNEVNPPPWWGADCYHARLARKTP